MSSLLDARVKIDGKTVGVLRNGQVLTTTATPGELQLVIRSDSDFKDLSLPLHVDPRGDYYVELMPQSAYIVGGPIVVPILRESGPVDVCNFNWCLAKLSTEDAKRRMSK